MDGANRQVLLNRFRIIPWERHFIQEEMITDKNRRSHGFGWHHRGLGDAVSEHPYKRDRRTDAFEPLPNTFFHNVPQYWLRPAGLAFAPAHHYWLRPAGLA